MKRHHSPTEEVLVSIFLRVLPATRLLVAVLAFGTIAACTDDPVSPFQPDIGNEKNSFQLQASNLTNVTTTATYPWVNEGTRATINHSTTTTAGSAQLVIKDAIGATVYDKALTPSLNEPTTAGQAGTWSIQVTLSNYSGTMNFRVQKL